MAPILGDFDEIVGPNIAPECRWVHGYDGMLNRLKVRPPIGLRNAADNLVGERASPTTVGEHDHSVSRGIAHHIALKDCRPAMLEVNLRRGSSYAHAQTPPDALRWPHACRHHHPCHLLIEHTVRFSQRTPSATRSQTLHSRSLWSTIRQPRRLARQNVQPRLRSSHSRRKPLPQLLLSRETAALERCC